MRLAAATAAIALAATTATAADDVTPLLEAVRNGDTEKVEGLLAAGADASAANRFGVTPLAVACTSGDAETVARLLRAGANPNTPPTGGEPPLLTAARTGRPGVIALLLDAGVPADLEGPGGHRPLAWAAAEGHGEAALLLVSRGADPDGEFRNGLRPLHLAARGGHRDVTRVLLESGADVSAATGKKPGGRLMPKTGSTPLVFALENAHFDLAVDLLEAGADPNDLGIGRSPLHILTNVRKPNRGDGEDGMPPPEGSGTRTSEDMIRELVAHGADVNLRLPGGSSGGHRLGSKGATPLLFASKTADLEMIRLLVELGADPFLTNVDGTTPLMAAAGQGTHAPTEEAGTEPEALETAAYLIALGADVNAVDKNGETVMHGAAYKSFPAMVAFLQENGADVDVWHQKNRHGQTPLLIAQGFRPGNFKPAPATRGAIETSLRAHGIDPPAPPSRESAKKKGYEK